MLVQVRSILDDVEMLVRTARMNGEGVEGSLCIGVVSSIAGSILRRLLNSFRASYPGVAFLIVDGSPRDHVPAVAALRMDATFVVGAPDAADCEVEPLWTERIMIALPEFHRLSSSEGELSWDDLTDERFIVSRMAPGPEIQDYVIRHLACLGRYPEIEPRPVNRDSLIALVGLGLGISLVGEAEAAVQYPGVVFRPLRGGELPFHIVWSTKNDNPAFRRFLVSSRAEAQRFARQ